MDLLPLVRKAARKIVRTSSSNPMMALVPNQVEKREPESGIDTAVVDSLKALDLERPIMDFLATLLHQAIALP